MAINRGNPRKQKEGQTTDDQTNNAAATATKRSKPKEHETQTVVVEGVVVDTDSLLIVSDDKASDYVDLDFDVNATNNEFIAEQITASRREKTFLPPKPKAAITKAKKLKKDNSSSETREQPKEQEKKTNENRLMTRNEKTSGKRKENYSLKMTETKCRLLP